MTQHERDGALNRGGGKEVAGNMFCLLACLLLINVDLKFFFP